MQRILVIDDEEFVRAMFRICLERTGKYEVLTAADGKQGLKMARKEQPDLILLDVTMPRMNGLEVLKRLGAREQTRFIPVIMVTGDDRDETMSKAMYQYADRYLVKPIERDVLLESVAKTLERKGRGQP